jgi:hypothetical protein
MFPPNLVETRCHELRLPGFKHIVSVRQRQLKMLLEDKWHDKVIPGNSTQGTTWLEMLMPIDTE